MQVGSIVELVEDFDAPTREFCKRHGVTLPEKGVPYTVNALSNAGRVGGPQGRKEMGICLEEIRNPRLIAFGSNFEPFWPAKKFRELLPPQSSEEIESLLNEVVHHEEEEMVLV